MEHSTAWKGSTRPKKQRKYAINAPLHISRARLSAHLSKTLRKEYKRRAVPVRAGDRVKVMRGRFSGKTGAVERTDSKEAAVYITGIDIQKRDGSKKLLPIHASNLQIEELELKDRERIESIRKTGRLEEQQKTDTKKGK